jgi:hypothetical protein
LFSSLLVEEDSGPQPDLLVGVLVFGGAEGESFEPNGLALDHHALAGNEGRSRFRDAGRTRSIVEGGRCCAFSGSLGLHDWCLP